MNASFVARCRSVVVCSVVVLGAVSCRSPGADVNQPFAVHASDVGLGSVPPGPLADALDKLLQQGAVSYRAHIDIRDGGAPSFQPAPGVPLQVSGAFDFKANRGIGVYVTGEQSAGGAVGDAPPVGQQWRFMDRETFYQRRQCSGWVRLHSDDAQVPSDGTPYHPSGDVPGFWSDPLVYLALVPGTTTVGGAQPGSDGSTTYAGTLDYSRATGALPKRTAGMFRGMEFESGDSGVAVALTVDGQGVLRTVKVTADGAQSNP